MIRAILDSEFYLDGGAMNGIVPRVLWSKQTPPDELGRIRLASRVIIFEEKGAGKLWMIEAGMGDGWDEKKKAIYRIEKNGESLVKNIQNAGYSPDDITDIILTHLHFDHSSGIVTYEENGEIKLTFPSARIHVQEKQLNWALSPSIKDEGSYRNADIKFLSTYRRLVRTDGARNLSNSVSLQPLFGHTEAMQMVTIRNDGETIVIVADLIPIFSHVRIPWIMAYDLRPLITIEEKIKFLQQASKENWTVISIHDPEIVAAKIHATPKGNYEIEPLVIQ